MKKNQKKSKTFFQALLLFFLTLAFSLSVSGVVLAEGEGEGEGEGDDAGTSQGDPTASGDPTSNGFGGTAAGGSVGEGACGNPDGNGPEDVSTNPAPPPPPSSSSVCPGSCTDWSSWSACSATCSVGQSGTVTGTQTSTRTCTSGVNICTQYATPNDYYSGDECLASACSYSSVEQSQSQSCSVTCTVVTACVPGAWTPDPSEHCAGDFFTQSNGCDTRQEVGTADCGTSSCTPSCGTWIPTSSWSAACGSVSRDRSRTCVAADCSTYTETGVQTSYIDCSCTPTSWSPDPSGYCDTVSVPQVSNCGTTRTVLGTQSCTTACIPNSWTPDPNTVCAGESFIQDSNCPGVSQSATGTLTCGVDECQNGPGDTVYEYCIGDDIYGRYRQVLRGCSVGGCYENNAFCTSHGPLEECESGYTCQQIDTYNAECVPKSSNWTEI